jgi:hypothetical protein
VEETDGCVFVPLEEEQTIERIKNTVVPEEREAGADEDA